MRHRRGIDLIPSGRHPSFLGHADELEFMTFGKLSEWYVLGGRCVRCEREGWLDRWELQRRFGRETFLKDLTHKLRCMGCGNRKGNRWIIGKLPR